MVSATILGNHIQGKRCALLDAYKFRQRQLINDSGATRGSKLRRLLKQSPRGFRAQAMGRGYHPRRRNGRLGTPLRTDRASAPLAVILGHLPLVEPRSISSSSTLFQQSPETPWQRGNLTRLQIHNGLPLISSPHVTACSAPCIS